MQQKKRWFDYEILLKYTGAGDKVPYKYSRSRGFRKPIVLAATSQQHARKQLKLPKDVAVKQIKRAVTCSSGKIYNIPKKRCMEPPKD
jgi:hypothetical protein